MIGKALKATRLLWAKNKIAVLIYWFNLALKLAGSDRGWFIIRGRFYSFRDRGIASLVIYKEIVLGLYDAKLQRQSRVVDVGAHIGMFAIPLARENPYSNFLCIEPDAINYANLVENIRTNRIKNIEARNVAVRRDGSRVQIVHDNWNSGGSRAVNGDDVASVSLHDLGACELLKIDIEGGEYDAIQSSDDWAQAKEMIIEVHQHHLQPKMVEYCKGARVILE